MLFLSHSLVCGKALNTIVTLSLSDFDANQSHESVLAYSEHLSGTKHDAIVVKLIQICTEFKSELIKIHSSATEVQ